MKYILILSILLCNMVYGQEDSSLTVGIITKQNTIDTILCLVAIMNTETSKFDTTVLYSLKQLYKWQRKGDNTSKPHYYYNGLGYLDENKKPISKNIVVIKELEWL